MEDSEMQTSRGGKLDSPVSSHLYELCWKHARDAMFVADLSTGLLVDMNPAAEALSGYSRQELLGKHFCILHPEEERGPLEAAFHTAAFPRADIEGFHFQRKDGKILADSISSSAPFGPEGRQLVVGIHRDVSELAERECRLVAQNWALSAYAEAALALGRARSSESLMQDLCEAITHESAYLLAWVGIAEDDPGKSIRIAAAAGSAVSYLDGLQLSWSEEDALTGRGPAGTCIRTNTLQVFEDYQASPLLPVWIDRAKRLGICSGAGIPLSVEHGWRGALVVYSSQLQAFGPVVTEAFTHLAEEIGIGLRSLRQAERLEAERRHREQVQKELAEAMQGVVSAITTAMEMRDPYTAGHQHRVAELACSIGKEMGWAEDRLLALRVAAQVHDIGKIAIPTKILIKPTPLTNAEWALIREHPETGYLILKDVPFHWPIAETVRQHHERIDGSGYPRGLKGDAILLGARILAVADILESMASARPYRAARGIDAALDEIEKQAGTLLDAEVVRICVRRFREQGFVLPS